MEKKSVSTNVFVFFVGIAVGISVFLVFWLFLGGAGSTVLSGRPVTFGNVKIWAQKPVFAEGAEVPEGFYQKNAKELWMTKDDILFLFMTQDDSGKVGKLYLCKSDAEPVLYMISSDSSGRWGRATYSKSTKAGHAVGDAFIDIDFDGRFDFKMVLDDEGNRISRSIYIDGSWRKVDQSDVDKFKAAVGQTLYTFDLRTGSWQQQ